MKKQIRMITYLLKFSVTAATKPGICLRKSVAPQARKMRDAPCAMRFIITFSLFAEALEVYRAGTLPECKVSCPENRSSNGCH